MEEKEMTLDEQMERFSEIEDKLERDRREYNNLEARFNVEREQYIKKKNKLEEKGITFKSGKELQSIYRGKKQRVEELLSEMEDSLGISDEDEVEDILDI